MKRAACPLHPLRDHVDDHRLVFDIVVVKAVDKGVALAGYGAAMGALFHLRHTGRGKGQAQRMADEAMPSRHRGRGDGRLRPLQSTRPAGHSHRVTAQGPCAAGIEANA